MSPPKTPKPFWSFGVLASAGSLCIGLLIFLWGFQIIRSLHYEIVRDSTSWSCAPCDIPQTAKLRVFAGFPPASRTEKAASPDASRKPATFHIWVHEPAGYRAGKHQSYAIHIGTGDFTVAETSDGEGRTSWQAVGGMQPEARFVYFVFLDKTGLTKSWADADSRPTFIILNWAGLRGYLWRSFSVSDFILAVLGSFLCVGFLRYCRLHFRTLLPPPRRRPDVKWLAIHGGIAILILSLYCAPWFHNIVLLYFSLLALGVHAVRNLWRRADPIPPARLRPTVAVILMLILAAAFALRADKADWGFPLVLHTDESAITDFPPRMAARNTLDPIDFERPNHGSIYLNSILYGIASHLRFHQPLQDTFAEHQFFYHWMSRLAVAMLGTLLVLAAYAVGAEFHPRFGLWAALVFALYPPFIRHSHFVTPDISTTLLVLGTMLFSLRYLRAPSPANLFYACACAAAATSEKYPGVLALTALAASLLIVHYRSGSRLLLTAMRAGLAYLGFLFCFTPYLFLKPQMVLLNLISESRPTHPGSDGLNLIGNLAYYLRTYAGSTSLILALFTFAGGIALVKRHRLRSLPLFLGFVYWGILSGLPLHWERWDLQMVVTPLLLAAYGIHVLWERGLKLRPRWRFAARTGVALLALAACVDLGLKDAALLADFRSPDTRWIGQEKLDALGVNDVNALADQYTPLAPIWKPGFNFIASYRDSATMQGRRYAVLSSDFYDRYFHEPEKYPDEVRFYDSLFHAPLLLDLKPNPLPDFFSAFDDFTNLRRAIPAWRFYADHRGTFSVGPEIRVYRLNNVTPAKS